MGTDRSSTHLEGIGIPHPSASLWEAESGEYDAGGVRQSAIRGQSPIAGTPEPDQTTSLDLRATGEQTDAIRVRLNRSGLPDLDDCGYLWALVGDGDVLLRGCDLSQVVRRWEPMPTWIVGRHQDPHACVADDDTVVAAAWNNFSGAIDVQYLTPGAATWTAVPGVATTAYGHPCLLRIGTRIHLYYWVQAGTEWYVQYHYSDDRGATWALGGKATVTGLDATGTGYTSVGRLRFLYVDGVVAGFGYLVHADTLVGTIYQNRLVQWASSDGGHQLEQVTASTGTEASSPAKFDATVHNGAITLAIIRWDAAAGYAYVDVKQVPSAWYPYHQADNIGTTAAIVAGQNLASRSGGGAVDFLLSGGEIALVSEDDGSLVLLLHHDVAPYLDACPMLRSADDGETWTTTGSSAIGWGPGQVWWHQDGAAPYHYSAVFCRGRTLVLTDWDPGAVANSIGALWLGGWSTAPHPARYGIIDAGHRTAWDETGYPVVLATLLGWAETLGGGAAAPVLTAGSALRTTCAGGQSVTYDSGAAPVVTVALGLSAECSLAHVVGSNGTAYLELQTSDATPVHYQVRIEATPVQLRAYDVIAGAALGGVQAYTANSRIRLRIEIHGSTVTAMWCYDTDNDDDRIWYTLYSGATTSAAANPGNNIRWQAGSLAVVDWHEYPHWRLGTWGLDYWSAQGVTTLMPRSLSGTGTWAGKGVRLSAGFGPGIQGDEWDVYVDDEYPARALEPRGSYPSPRHPWRSRKITDMGATTTEIRLSWRVDTADADVLSDLWHFWLDKLNCGGGSIYGYWGGAWHLIASLGHDEFSGTRTGRSITRAAAGAVTGSHTWRRDELADCGFEILDAAGAVSSFRGTIETSWPGITRIGSGTSVPLRFRADDVTGAPAGAVRVRLWPRRHLVLWRPSSASTSLQGVQLRIPVQTAAPYAPYAPPTVGYYEAGIFSFGPVAAWGWLTGDGNRESYEPGHELLEAEDRTRAVREVAPQRITREVSWPEGATTYQWAVGAAPDYVTADTGGDPLGIYQGIAYDVADIARSVAGYPVVHLRPFTRGATGGFKSWGYGALYCRLVGSIELDEAQGILGREDGVTRVQRVSASEEV